MLYQLDMVHIHHCYCTKMYNSSFHCRSQIKRNNRFSTVMVHKRKELRTKRCAEVEQQIHVLSAPKRQINTTALIMHNSSDINCNF